MLLDHMALEMLSHCMKTSAVLLLSVKAYSMCTEAW